MFSLNVALVFKTCIKISAVEVDNILSIILLSVTYFQTTKTQLHANPSVFHAHISI